MTFTCVVVVEAHKTKNLNDRKKLKRQIEKETLEIIWNKGHWVNEQRRKSGGAEMGWRKRRRKGMWSGKHGRNVLMIEAVTWAQQAGKSPIVSDLKLEFFLFRFGTNISAEIRYRLRYDRNDRLNRPTVRPVEPQFVRFSQISCISGFLCLKNRILVRFSVFSVGPSGFQYRV